LSHEKAAEIGDGVGRPFSPAGRAAVTLRDRRIMSRKHKSKHGRREDEASRMDRPTETAGQDARALRLTPIKFGIGLGVVVLGAAALFSPPLRDRKSVV